MMVDGNYRLVCACARILFVCMCIWLHVHMEMRICLHLSFFPLRQGLWVIWNSPSGLPHMASKFQTPVWLCSPALGLQVYTTTLAFYTSSGHQIQDSACNLPRSPTFFQKFKNEPFLQIIHEFLLFFRKSHFSHQTAVDPTNRAPKVPLL